MAWSRDTPPIPLLRPFDCAQGERNAPPLGKDGIYFVSLPTQEWRLCKGFIKGEGIEASEFREIERGC